MIAKIISAALGTVGFSLLFGVPKKYFLNCAMIGGAGWFGYEMALALGCGTGAAAFVGTVLLALLSRFAAVYCQCPTTVFLIAGIFPLVPGAGIYWTAYYLVSNQLNDALSSGATALKVIFGIVLGIIFVFEIPYKVFAIARPRKREQA